MQIYSTFVRYSANGKDRIVLASAVREENILALDHFDRYREHDLNNTRVRLLRIYRRVLKIGIVY